MTLMVSSSDRLNHLVMIISVFQLSGNSDKLKVHYIQDLI